MEVFTAALLFQELEDGQLMFDGAAAQKNVLEERSGLNRLLLLHCFCLLVLPSVCACALQRKYLHRFCAHITGVPPGDKLMDSSSYRRYKLPF